LQPFYREAPIRAALVYLDGPTLAPVSGEELDAALDVIAAASWRSHSGAINSNF
jgi:hypothetical protein